MEITLHNTTKTVTINGVPGRIWEGHTASGIPIHAFITRIAVPDGHDPEEFLRELESARSPSPDVQAIPLRLLI